MSDKRERRERLLESIRSLSEFVSELKTKYAMDILLNDDIDDVECLEKLEEVSEVFDVSE